MKISLLIILSIVLMTNTSFLTAYCGAKRETIINADKFGTDIEDKIIHSRRTDQKLKFGIPGQVCGGVNIHFVKGHEQDLDMIAAAGFKFIRMDFVWQEIEHTRGTYDWSAYDELTENLDKRGLRAIYILDYSNSLYESEVESKDPITGEKQNGIAAPCHPESIAAFARWASAAAEHFKESNVVWEIWNEPNITFWMPAPDVAQYNILASSTCKAIRSVVPDAVIIGPATSQIPLPFIEAFLASGILEYLDAVSVHPYREYSKSPETAIADYRKVSDLIEKYAPTGKADIPVISSEWGYASATKGLSIETQSQYLVRMQLTNVLYGIPVSIWYDWKNDGTEPGNFEHNCGTVTFDLKPKPAYDAVKVMNSELNGFTFLRRIVTGNENDYLLLFKDNTDRYKIAAWSTDPPHSVNIGETIQNIQGVTIRDGKGNLSKAKSGDEACVLYLTNLPQYISVPAGTIIR